MILFLHGWPEDRTTFDGVMSRLSADHDVAALDLPGVGDSTELPPASDKRTLARLVNREIAIRPEAIAPAARAVYARAYERPAALHAGFEWYRAFPQDVKDNTADTTPVETSVLYIRGDHEFGHIDDYLNGLRASGLRDLRGAVIPDCGHFTPVEQPDALAAILFSFVAR